MQISRAATGVGHVLLSVCVSVFLEEALEGVKSPPALLMLGSQIFIQEYSGSHSTTLDLPGFSGEAFTL